MYDPQLEKFIDPVHDADEFARAFDVGVSHVQQITSEQEREGHSDHRDSLWRRIFRRR